MSKLNTTKLRFIGITVLSFFLFFSPGFGLALTGTPVLLTQDATNITSSQATLNAYVVNIVGFPSPDQRGFDWGTSSGSYSGSWTESGSFGAVAFSHNIAGLTPNTTYYFRAKAHNFLGWSYGSEKSFTTSGTTPTVTTQAASNISSNSATLNGDITNTGGENADQKGFDWGTSPGSYSGSWTESGSFGAGAFSHSITGLAPNTTYYFRAKAHNSAGWGYSSEKSFTTSGTTPTIATQNATDITFNQATLNGNITDTGGSVIETNIIPKSWVSKTENRSSEYASDSSVSGSVANTYDENFSTYREWYVHHGGDGRGSATLVITDTWANPRHLDKVKVKAWGRSYEGNYEGWKLEFNTYLLIGGTWTQVDRGAWARHSETRWPGYNEGPTNVDTSGSVDHDHRALYSRTLQSGWNNVTGMRVRVYSGGYSYEGDRQQRLYTRIYEMQAFVAQPATADKRGFEWGTSPGSYSSSWTEPGSFGTGAFSHNITGLTPNTTYYFRAKAHNSAGWSYGSEKSFTTLTAYIDCGLRVYDGTAVRAIACEPVGTLTSPLRIRKGSTTYGIVLVDPSDVNASKIRIRTSSGIKALRIY